ncbi:hypothetical protein [Serratia fonticola]|uniref:hypothetical protein n=1 Tax=Serratia fonticola TaxID=47917 RepID=UPI003AF3ADC9
MNIRLRVAYCVFPCLAFFAPAVFAENVSLNSEYAKLLMLSSTEDISASSFHSDEGMQFSKFSLPYVVFNVDMTDRFSLKDKACMPEIITQSMCRHVSVTTVTIVCRVIFHICLLRRFIWQSRIFV